MGRKFPRALGQWSTAGAVVVAGLLLRLYRLDNQSVWSDEAFSLSATRLPLPQMQEKIVEFSWNHPPLHYLLLHVWLRWFGFGPWQARLLSVLFGTLAVAMMYLLARYVFDRRTAVVAASLLAVSQLGVMYAQEARPYAQLLFFVLCSILLFVVALWERRTAAWWGFVVAATAMIYTHYYGGLVLAALLLYTWLCGRWRGLRIRWIVPGVVVAALPGMLWAGSGVIARGLHSNVGAAQPPWFAVYWWTPLASINDFNNGRFAGLHAPPPLWTFVAGALLFSVPGLLALRSLFPWAPSTQGSPSESERTLLLLILCALPLGLVWALGLLNVQYDVRYVLFCILPYYMLVARGLSGLRTAATRTGWTTLALAYGVCALRANYFVPYKENYRDALAYVADKYRAGDCCVFLPFERMPLEWAIYHGDAPPPRMATLETIASGEASCDRVWLITYRRVQWAIEQDEGGERSLQATHSRVSEREYFWVNVALYTERSRPSGS